MHHLPSLVQVYCTNEYGKFKTINGNRQLNEKKINRIIKDIESGIDVLQYYPITVREVKDRLEIIDGQHRFFISKKLKRLVYYILMQEDKSLPDIAKINSNVEKWKTADFINCYIQQGNENYSMLQDFMDKYGVSSTVGVKLLQLGNPGTETGMINMVQDFQRGLFKVQYPKEAVDIIDKVKQFEPFANWRDKNFIIAVYRIDKVGLVTFEELIAACKKNPDKLSQQPGFKEYISQLEFIYNIGKQKRYVIY